MARTLKAMKAVVGSPKFDALHEEALRVVYVSELEKALGIEAAHDEALALAVERDHEEALSEWTTAEAALAAHRAKSAPRPVEPKAASPRTESRSAAARKAWITRRADPTSRWFVAT